MKKVMNLVLGKERRERKSRLDKAIDLIEEYIEVGDPVMLEAAVDEIDEEIEAFEGR